MKLLRAQIKNFRLFHDIVVDFAVDELKNITLIRADTGKTTLLEALEWGVFGETAFPNAGAGLRPLDATTDLEPTTVIIDYRVTFPATIERTYRLIHIGFPDRHNRTRWLNS